jgi:signal transduction histidine kinase
MMRIMPDLENREALNILLIEDDEDDYVLIRDLLTDIPTRHHNVEWVPTYDEGFQALKRGGWEVCLIDYRLGANSGLELLEEARMLDLRTPIILLTGQGDFDVDMKAMESGVSDYLVKDDLNAPLLERSIRYTIEREKARKALQKSRDDLEQRVLERTEELAAANEALKLSHEKLKFFAYSVAHDLKNPALSLHGLTVRLYEHYGELLDKKGKTYCSQILNASKQIASLVDQINVFIESKESPINIEVVDLKEIFGLLREEFSDQIITRELSWSEPDRLPAVRADRLCMIRVFRNLVDNAIKYGGDDLKKIKFGHTDGDDFHIFSVSDDGRGIKGDDSESIFGPFEREVSSNGVEGSGMGLAIVKETAERHRGKVWAESGSDKGVDVFISISKSL